MQTETVEIPFEILDKATKEAKKIQSQMNQIEKAAKKAGVSQSAYNKALANTKKEAQQAAKSTQKQSMAFTEMNSAVSLLREGFQKLKQVYDFAKEGAQLDRLGEASEEVFRQMGGNIEDATRAIQEASLDTVSEVDAMAAATRAAMLNVSADADQLAQLMQIAAFRGRAMGVDTTQAFSDMVTGIGRASPMILDNLGIITKGWAEEAKAAGVAYDAQFILNKVLEQGGEQLEMAGGLAEDAATSYEQLEAALKDLGGVAQETSDDAIQPLIKQAGDAARGWQEFLEYIRDTSAIRKLAQEMRDFQDPGGDWQQFFEDARRAYYNSEKSLDELGISTDEYTARIAHQAVVLSDELNPAIENTTKANREYLGEIGKISSEYQKYNDDINDINTERAEIEGKMQADLAAGWWEGSDRIQGYKEKLQELEDKDNELTESFEDNSDRRVLALLEEQLSADDLTEAETRWLEEIGIAKGIYSQEAVDQWRAERDEVELLIGSIGRIPTEWTTNLRINTIGSVPAFAGSELDFRVSAGQGRAGGGPVMSGQSYLVGERGPEVFTPQQSGNITPNNQIGGGIDENALARAIVTAMQRAQ